MNHWDKEIQETMKQREIAPSEKAWDKLELMLNDEKSSAHNAWLWKYVAAVVIIGGILGYIFIDTSTVYSKNESTIALEKVEGPVIINNEPIKQPDTPAMNAVVVGSLDSQTKNKKTETYTNSNSRNLPNSSQDESMRNDTTNPKVVAHEKQNLLTIQEDSTIMTNTRPKQPKTAESYLLEALHKTKSSKQASIVVNENSLLNDVEEDLFKEQSHDLLNKITNQLKEAHVAIKERNIQE